MENKGGNYFGFTIRIYFTVHCFMKQAKQMKQLKHFSTPKTAKMMAKTRLLGRFFDVF